MLARRRFEPILSMRLLAIMLLIPLLADCGTLEVGIDSTAAPTLGASAPIPTEPVHNAGSQTNGHSSSPDISADGRHVVFSSAADNLVPGDTNQAADIFVYDRETRTTELISVTEDGAPANNASGEPGISANGRWVVFSSIATNLVAEDKNGLLDIFLHDRETGSTVLVSEALDGGSGTMMSMGPSISANGRWVSFTSFADNLVPRTDEHTGADTADTNDRGDIFVYDRLGGGIRRVSLSSEGEQGNHNSGFSGISADGRWAVFWSLADNLVPGAGRGIYLRDRATGTTHWIADGQAPTISPDGRWIGFLSVLSDLAPGDPLCAVLHDRQADTVTVLGAYAQGGIDGAPSEAVRFSPDNAWLTFQSTFRSPDSMGDGGEWGQQVWLREQESGTLTLISVAPDGSPGNSISASASLSSGGRWIAYQSLADNLVAGHSNGYMDIFVHDRETGVTEVVTNATPE